MLDNIPHHVDQSFKLWFYKEFMPKIYGIGAAIVITGAMFKLLSWPGGGFMLGLGLATEAIIFFLSAFEPKEKITHWEKVYPELADDYDGPPTHHHNNNGLGEKVDELFAQAKIDTKLVERLGQGMHHLAESTTQIASLSNAAEVTEQYVQHVSQASETLAGMNEIYGTTLNAIQDIASVSQNTQAYNEQIQHITQSLGALDSANDLHASILASMQKMQEASEEAETFKVHMGELSEKLSSLNSIYGNMLTAFKN